MHILPQPLDCQETRFKNNRPLHISQFPQTFGIGRQPNRFLHWLRPQSSLPLPPITKRCHSKAGRRQVQSVVALSLSVVALTAAMGQRFYRQPELQVGTIAPKTIFALEDAVVVDQETTEEKRIAARNGAAPVLIPSAEKNKQIQNSLDSLFQQVDALRLQVGQLPLTTAISLTETSQHELREASASDWQVVWSVFKAVVVKIPPERTSLINLESLLTEQKDFRALSLQQQQLVRELLRDQQGRSLQDLQSLQRQIEIARTNYQRALRELNRLAQGDQGLPDSPEVFRLSESEWISLQQEVRLVLGRMLQQGIAEGVPRDLLAVAVEAHLKGTVPNRAETLANGFLVAVLEPNLVEDPVRTREKAETAAEQVPEVTLTVQEGERIVLQGETIDQTDFVLLDHFGLSRRRLNIWGLVGFGVLIAGAAGIFLLAEQTVRPALRKRDHGLIVCMLLGTSGLSVVGLAVYSLPAVGLLVSSFYGATLGATLVGLLAGMLPIGTRVSMIPLLASTAGALVCSVIAPRLRSREELALLGGIVGFIQGAVYLALTWMMSPISLATWYLPLTRAVIQGGCGVISSVIALGLSPYLEHLFDLVTPIRLAELSSPNRPTLKRLASEAPGTFQHTLFVASLAEAAARALNCNVELVRAGTLYHDIGKMHDPLGFIENQMGGTNKHDEINDPWVSADIIKKHVSEGSIMARRCRLPKAVRAFIPEHQGTMLISYFYYQAQERAKVDENLVINEQDFRYDGPIPQSPETGIVMLADSCEAALRSLEDASPKKALAMVNRILKARWHDHQLVDSGLTREHMNVIAQVFVQVWQQYNHKRIAYPKGSLNPVTNRS